MELCKLPEETVKEYFVRICENKVAFNLNWEEIAQLMNTETGKAFGESKYRKQWRYYSEGRDDGFKQAVETGEPLKNFEESLLKLEEEKIKVRDRHVSLNRTIRSKARFENIIEELKFHMSQEMSPLECNFSFEKSKGTEKIIVACFSDFHAGADFKNHFGEYSMKILQRRLGEYVSKLIQVGFDNKVGTIKILGLGDFVNGTINVSGRIESSDDVIEQVQKVSEYISQALVTLSENFETVEYYSVIGNHGRVMQNKSEALYNENFEKLIPWYIKARVSDFDNIQVFENDVDSGIIVTKVFNNTILGCHGDKDSYERCSTVLPNMLKVFPSEIYLGHLHSFGVESKYDIQTIRSGSLGGTDEYAKNLRLSGSPSQTFVLYNRDGIECIYPMVFK